MKIKLPCGLWRKVRVKKNQVSEQHDPHVKDAELRQ